MNPDSPRFGGIGGQPVLAGRTSVDPGNNKGMYSGRAHLRERILSAKDSLEHTVLPSHYVRGYTNLDMRKFEKLERRLENLSIWGKLKLICANPVSAFNNQYRLSRASCSV